MTSETENLGEFIDNIRARLGINPELQENPPPSTSQPTIPRPSVVIDPTKYLSKLPEFDGNPSHLQNFTDLIDRVHPILQTYDELSQLIFSDLIRSKLKGRAREITEINYHARSWTEMKTLLNNNFGDRKSSEQLFDDLRSITFRTNSQDFYNEIKTALRRLNLKTINECNSIGKDPKRTLKDNIRSALNLFKNKIPEPMKSILYCRAPEDLETAISILHDSGHAFFNPFSNSYSRPTSSRRNNHNYQQYPSPSTGNQSSVPRPNNYSQPRNNTGFRNNFQTPMNTPNNPSQPRNNTGFRNSFNNFQTPINNPNNSFQPQSNTGPRNNFNNFQTPINNSNNFFQPRNNTGFRNNPNNFNNRFVANNNHTFGQNTNNQLRSHLTNSTTSNSNFIPTRNNPQSNNNRPEPMEVDLAEANEPRDSVENFRSNASETNYPI